MNKSIAVVIVLLLVVVVVLSRPGIAGFWLAGDEFMQRAGLKQFIMFFEDGGSGYMTLSTPSQLLYNDIMEWSFNPITNNITLKWRGEPPAVLPACVKMQLDAPAGHMLLKDIQDGTVYAELYRDNQMSKTTILHIDADGEN